MRLNKLNRNAVRSTEALKGVTVLSEKELQNTVGGAALQPIIGFCFPCPGFGCIVYIDIDCFYY